MKYKSDYDIVMDDGVYKTVNGIVEMPYELPKSFIRIEENTKPVLSEKDELIKMAVDLGCGAESSLKRNSIETLKKKIEEA